MMTRWRELSEVVGYETCAGYRVSDTGQMQTRKVRSKGKNPPGQRGVRWVIGNIWLPLKVTKNTLTAYGQVQLLVNDKQRTVLVHHLVMLAFGSPKPHPKAWVLHRDDNKDNNAIGNLYWGTPKQNCDDRARNGHQINLRGEDCPYARLTEDQVREIMASPESYSVIESRFGVSNSMVSFIKSGKRWAHVQGEKLRRKQGPPVGTPSVRRSLTDAQAADVRRRALAGESQRSLATEFGIPQQCVSKIKCGLIYSNA